jgi:hypothetical protein
MKKIANLFDKKIAKILLPSPHSAAMNNAEFMAARGRGTGFWYLYMTALGLGHGMT